MLCQRVAVKSSHDDGDGGVAMSTEEGKLT
jgi:hypothetical protein